MVLGILQANLNYARRTQDLFVHSLAERDFGLGIAAEPYRVPVPHPCWVGDVSGSVAITWKCGTNLPLCSPRETGRGFVCVK